MSFSVNGSPLYLINYLKKIMEVGKILDYSIVHMLL